MNGDQIRRTFLEFFQEKGHTVMPSSSLVPTGDPTMLFTSAGMVPLKPYFTGETTPPSRRLTSCQKSFRTTDVDEVGDHKHLTFFEMLGNFSIGDYFKREAIAWSWEFVTQHFNLPAERLYVTVYLDDEEAYSHWSQDIGVPQERIFRYGDKDNWWGPAGVEGPCGPCSEIHYDGGLEYGCGQPDCHPNHDCERFVELWNLVFMQFYQDAKGNRTPLPRPSIDTGLGLERAAAILQGKRTIYETDLFQPIIQTVCQLTGKSYGQDRDTDYALRVVAEHGRAAAFLIADSVMPSNEGRGSVLRRIIRRAIRYGRQLGLEQPFLAQVAEAAIERFRQAYAELLTDRNHIFRVVEQEENAFRENLPRGLRFFSGFTKEIPSISKDLEKIRHDLESTSEMTIEAALSFLGPVIRVGGTGPVSLPRLAEMLSGPEETYGALKAREILVDRSTFDESASTESKPASDQMQEITLHLNRTEQKLDDAQQMLPGGLIFHLYTTYGFPPELTAEIAREHGLEPDMEGFEGEMKDHREISRPSHAFSGGMEVLTTYENLGVDKVNFVGYEQLARDSLITAILVDNAPAGHAAKGQSVEVVLKETPFYAEGGGQVGDAGVIAGPNGRVRVEDTQSPVAGLIVHRGVVEEGDMSLGEQVNAHVDPSRRLDTARNHSGTHLLHAALRNVLGLHVRQAGSLVAPDRLRFDYSHVSALAREELQEIQDLVNEKVRDNLKVDTMESTYSQALEHGALAFFGDKYGDVIRVVEMADGERFSYEVCGGTHVGATGQIGPVFVVGESSIGGGMRRIEAVSGRAAEGLFVERSSLLESLSHKLQTPLVDLDSRLDSFMSEMDSLRKRLAVLERERLRRESQELLGKVQDVGGIKVLAEKTSADSSDSMLEMGDWLKDKMASGVIVLAAVQNGLPSIVAMVTSDLVARGLNAGNIVRETARVIGGGGGGRAEMAQAGGKRADKLDEALARVSEVVRKEAGL